MTRMLCQSDDKKSNHNVPADLAVHWLIIPNTDDHFGIVMLSEASLAVVKRRFFTPLALRSE